MSAQQVADGADPIVFAHAPLVAGQNYTYTVTAVAADGKEAVGTPLTGSALALGCTPSTYEPEGLVAYYSFEGDLSDSAGSYDLTPTGDSIAYSNGCVNGKAGHFDGDGGYAYNLDFNDENVDEVADGSWSISVWVNADEDMNKWSSVFSTTAVKDEFDTGADSWGEGFQLNVTDNMRPQLYGCREDHCDGSQKLTAPNALELNTWTHLAVTMDNGTANLYVNGENVVTYEGMITEFNRLKVGLNRRGQESWKGYIDELMVFGDTLSDEDIANVYKNTLPGTPQNATATNWAGDTVVVGWDAVDGINEYRVYYATGGAVDANSPYITVTGGTVVNFDNLTAGQNYTYAVAGVSPLGVGELSVPTTITVDYASVDAEIAARFTATGAEELLWLSSGTQNGHGFFNRLPVFPDDVWRIVGLDNVTYNPLTTTDPIAMAPNPTQGSNYRYSYGDFRMFIHPFDQYQQNEFADWAMKPECKDKDFRTLVSWMGCIGADFNDKFQSYLKGLPISHRQQFTSILRAATLGADGVWQLQFKHHVWGFYQYQIIR